MRVNEDNSDLDISSTDIDKAIEMNFSFFIHETTYLGDRKLFIPSESIPLMHIVSGKSIKSVNCLIPIEALYPYNIIPYRGNVLSGLKSNGCLADMTFVKDWEGVFGESNLNNNFCLDEMFSSKDLKKEFSDEVNEISCDEIY